MAFAKENVKVSDNKNKCNSKNTFPDKGREYIILINLL
jgi:hypothetical protein